MAIASKVWMLYVNCISSPVPGIQIPTGIYPRLATLKLELAPNRDCIYIYFGKEFNLFRYSIYLGMYVSLQTRLSSFPSAVMHDVYNINLSILSCVAYRTTKESQFKFVCMKNSYCRFISVPLLLFAARFVALARGNSIHYSIFLCILAMIGSKLRL